MKKLPRLAPAEQRAQAETSSLVARELSRKWSRLLRLGTPRPAACGVCGRMAKYVYHAPGARMRPLWLCGEERCSDLAPAIYRADDAVLEGYETAAELAALAIVAGRLPWLAGLLEGLDEAQVVEMCRHFRIERPRQLLRLLTEAGL